MEAIGQEPRGDRAVKQAFFTSKPGVLYAITPGWPGSELVIRDVRCSPDMEATLLGMPGRLSARVDGRNLILRMPSLPVDGAPCRDAFAFKLAGVVLLPEAAP